MAKTMGNTRFANNDKYTRFYEILRDLRDLGNSRLRSVVAKFESGRHTLPLRSSCYDTVPKKLLRHRSGGAISVPGAGAGAGAGAGRLPLCPNLDANPSNQERSTRAARRQQTTALITINVSHFNMGSI